MKEFQAEAPVRINLIPTQGMEREARERVARTLEITREHVLESQLRSETPFGKAVEIAVGDENIL